MDLTAAFRTARFEVVGMSAGDAIGQDQRDGLCGLIQALEPACRSIDMAERAMSAAVSASGQGTSLPFAAHI